MRRSIGTSTSTKQKLPKPAQPPLSLGVGADEQSDALRSLKQIGYDIYVRAGLVEFLLEHPEARSVSSKKPSRSSRSGNSSWCMARSPRASSV